jgi:hypothetical protein
MSLTTTGDLSNLNACDAESRENEFPFHLTNTVIAISGKPNNVARGNFLDAMRAHPHVISVRFLREQPMMLLVEYFADEPVERTILNPTNSDWNCARRIC